MPTFRFVQLEVPWPLGPPDGRYLVRDPGADPDGPPAHVLLLATLGAPRVRRGLARRARSAPPEPDAAPVPTGRATVIDADSPLESEAEAARWLRGAGEPELAAGLAVLGRALHAHRLVVADPYARTVARSDLLISRVGFGTGEEVADGRWSAARELPAPAPRRRRRALLEPQAALAAVLSGRVPALACEELALRARLDVEEGRPREAALQLRAALDAALAELAADSTLAGRLAELAELRVVVDEAARGALGPNPPPRSAIDHALGRLESALRARAAP